MNKIKIFIALSSIILHIFSSSIMAKAEEVKKSDNSLTKVLESFDVALQQVLDSMYIVIDDGSAVYLHDSTSYARLTFNRSKRVSLKEMDSRVKGFVKKDGNPNLHSVFLMVAEDVPFKYLYEVIRCYEEAVYNSTGSNIVEYRFTSPLTPEIIKERIKENKKYPIH